MSRPSLSRGFGTLVLALFSICGAAQSQSLGYSPSGFIATLGDFGTSARADAIGIGFVGVADDASALFFNSAGLSGLTRPEISLSHTSHLSGVFEETLNYAFPTDHWGGFAVAAQYVHWDNLDGRDASGNPTGLFSNNDLGLALGWGWELAKDFSVGAATRATQQEFNNFGSLLTLETDVSFLWRLNAQLRLGFSLDGLPFVQDGLRDTVTTGLSGQWELGGDMSLLAAFSAQFASGDSGQIQGGFEAGLDRHYFLRAGYEVPFLDDQVSGLTHLSLGAGIRLEDLHFDYAFIPYGDLGASNRLSLSYEFPKAAPHEAAPTPVETTPKTSLEVHFELPGDSGGAIDPDAVKKIAKFKLAVGKNPNDAQAWRDLGVVYFRSGQVAEALQCFEQALRLKPGDKELQLWIEKYKGK